MCRAWTHQQASLDSPVGIPGVRLLYNVAVAAFHVFLLMQFEVIQKGYRPSLGALISHKRLPCLVPYFLVILCREGLSQVSANFVSLRKL